MVKSRVCIVEDETDLAMILKDYLEAAEYDTVVFNHGGLAQAWLAENTPDIILLDLMLPGVSGLDVCKAVRKTSDVPIIMLTAKVEEVDRLIGLELGADDYMCKPYSPREVVARVKAVLRRTLNAIPNNEASELNNNEIILSPDKNQISIHGTFVELTTVEFRLFQLLYGAPGRIFSRQYIMDNIYGDYRIVNDRTVDSHIKKLRKKLRVNEDGPELVRSVYGAGYKYEVP